MCSPLVSNEDAHQVSEMCSRRFRGCREASEACTPPGFAPAAESLPKGNTRTSFFSLSLSLSRSVACKEDFAVNNVRQSAREHSLSTLTWHVGALARFMLIGEFNTASSFVYKLK